MIPNSSLDCSYVVPNFWPNLSLIVLYKINLIKEACISIFNYQMFIIKKILKVSFGSTEL